MNELLVKTENLRIAFDDKGVFKTVVDDVDYNIYKGEILGIVGESGSGKTQAALSLLGIQSGWPGIIGGSMYIDNGRDSMQEMLSPLLNKSIYHSGSHLEKDKRLWRRESNQIFRKIRGKKIFMMFQDPKSYLNPYWNVKKHFKRILGYDKKNIDVKDMYQSLERFGLSSEIADEYPHSLSGGESQRVMIALGYACHPDLIIADEITTGLDLVNQLRVVDHLMKLKEERNLSILLISHDLGFISKLADKILVMYAGQSMEYGPAGKILDKNETYKHPYTKRLMEIYSDKNTVKFIEGPPPDRYLTGNNGCRFHARCEAYRAGSMNCDVKSPADFGSIGVDSHYIRCRLYE